MKVLVLTETMGYGGIGRYCVHLVAGLNELGVPTKLVGLGNSNIDHECTWLAEVARANSIPLEVLPLRFKVDYKAILLLAEMIKSSGIDILHTQGYRSNLIGRLATRFASADARNVSTLHGSPMQFSHLWRQRVYMHLEHLTSRWVAHYIAVDQRSSYDYQKYGICPSRVSVIHNGIAVLNPERGSQNRQKQNINIGYVGRLAYEKGIDLLIPIMKALLLQYPQLTFLVIGDGPEKHKLEAFLSDAKTDRVHLVGTVTDIEPYYAEMDILLIPSRSEGLPLVMLEAMAHCIPVIASSVGGIPEAITSGQNGILVPAGDVEGFIDQVRSLVEDKKKRIEFGQRAFQTVKYSFSRQTMCENTLNVYKHILGKDL